MKKEKDIELFNLEKQFAFHEAYHTNPVNIWIHILFVWPMLFTILMLLYFTPVFYSIPKCPCGFDHGLVINSGFVLTLIYVVTYVIFDKRAGSLAALLCLLCWVAASLLAKTLGWSITWKVALATHLFCWATQFVGHGAFEERKPTVLNNLAKGLLMVPFFIFLEILQALFNYEPYPGFNEGVKAKIEAEIKDFEAKKLKKVS